MLQPVAVAHKHLSDYASIVGRTLVDEIRERAEALAGQARPPPLGDRVRRRRVGDPLHARAADGRRRPGVRVARDLRARGVLQRDQGDAQRAPGQPAGPERASSGTRGGATTRSTPASWSEAGTCASSTIPQPAAICLARAGEGAPLGVALPHRPLDAEPGDARAAAARTSTGTRRRSTTCPPTCPPGIDGRAHIIPPAIDPLAPKNMAFSPEDAVYICDQFGIDVDRPLLCQVSRFDPWKDPLGVIDAYRIVKEQMPEVQLALVGSMATDDPEGWDFFNATVAHADGDPDIHILNNLNNVGAIEVNAFQSHCRRRDPEVDARGLRADRDRGDLEGTAVHRRRRRRHPAAGHRRRVRLPRLDRRGLRARARSRSCGIPGSASDWAGPARNRARQRFLTPRLLRDWLGIVRARSECDADG